VIELVGVTEEVGVIEGDMVGVTEVEGVMEGVIEGVTEEVGVTEGEVVGVTEGDCDCADTAPSTRRTTKRVLACILGTSAGGLKRRIEWEQTGFVVREGG